MNTWGRFDKNRATIERLIAILRRELQKVSSNLKGWSYETNMIKMSLTAIEVNSQLNIKSTQSSKE